VHGDLQRLDMPDLTPSDTKQYAYSVLTDAQKKRFEEALELDFSFGIRGWPGSGATSSTSAARWPPSTGSSSRTSAGSRSWRCRRCVDARRPAARPRAGHGPDRQRQEHHLAAMIDKINRERRQHILTIEDPIEYIHRTRVAW